MKHPKWFSIAPKVPRKSKNPLQTQQKSSINGVTTPFVSAVLFISKLPPKVPQNYRKLPPTKNPPNLEPKS